MIKKIVKFVDLSGNGNKKVKQIHQDVLVLNNDFQLNQQSPN